MSFDGGRFGEGRIPYSNHFVVTIFWWLLAEETKFLIEVGVNEPKESKMNDIFDEVSMKGGDL